MYVSFISHHACKHTCALCTYLRAYTHTHTRYVMLLQPEPITGSTRMKGGTTTKILLEVIFSLAHLLLRDHKITPTIAVYG